MQRVQQEVLSFTLPLVAAGEYDAPSMNDAERTQEAGAGGPDAGTDALQLLLAQQVRLG